VGGRAYRETVLMKGYVSRLQSSLLWLSDGGRVSSSTFESTTLYFAMTCTILYFAIASMEADERF
jgi:hypothetical protein